MTSKLIVLLLSKVDGFSLILVGMMITLVGGVMIGMLVGLTLKEMGYPDHIALLFPLVPISVGGIITFIGLHYSGDEEKIHSQKFSSVSRT